MNWQWLSVGVAMLAGLLAILWARRVTKRIERLSQSYWELRYEQGQLNARLGRLEPADEPSGQGAEADAAARPKSNFVPLSSLRK